MCGAQALLAHRYRGFGPGISDVLPLLSSWVEKDVSEKDKFIALTSEQSGVSESLQRVVQREIEREAKEAKEALGYRDIDFDKIFGSSNSKSFVDHSSNRALFAKSVSEAISIITAESVNIEAALTHIGKVLSVFNSKLMISFLERSSYSFLFFHE
jgi:hypothetical protein